MTEVKVGVLPEIGLEMVTPETYWDHDKAAALGPILLNDYDFWVDTLDEDEFILQQIDSTREDHKRTADRRIAEIDANPIDPRIDELRKIAIKHSAIVKDAEVQIHGYHQRRTNQQNHTQIANGLLSVYEGIYDANLERCSNMGSSSEFVEYANTIVLHRGVVERCSFTEENAEKAVKKADKLVDDESLVSENDIRGFQSLVVKGLEYIYDIEGDADVLTETYLTWDAVQTAIEVEFGRLIDGMYANFTPAQLAVELVKLVRKWEFQVISEIKQYSTEILTELESPQ